MATGLGKAHQQIINRMAQGDTLTEKPKFGLAPEWEIGTDIVGWKTGERLRELKLIRRLPRSQEALGTHDYRHFYELTEEGKAAATSSV